MAKESKVVISATIDESVSKFARELADKGFADKRSFSEVINLLLIEAKNARGKKKK